jgi:hypothetical protein
MIFSVGGARSGYQGRVLDLRGALHERMELLNCNAPLKSLLHDLEINSRRRRTRPRASPGSDQLGHPEEHARRPAFGRDPLEYHQILTRSRLQSAPSKFECALFFLYALKR